MSTPDKLFQQRSELDLVSDKNLIKTANIASQHSNGDKALKQILDHKQTNSLQELNEFATLKGYDVSAPQKTQQPKKQSSPANIFSLDAPNLPSADTGKDHSR